jgi:hypothetical protein
MSRRTQCLIGITGTGAVLGAVGGGAGTATIGKEPVDDAEIAAGAGVGMVAGALIGWGLSYWLCDEEETTPPASPPPAPSAPAPLPPERRGG